MNSTKGSFGSSKDKGEAEGKGEAYPISIPQHAGWLLRCIRSAVFGLHRGRLYIRPRESPSRGIIQ